MEREKPLSYQSEPEQTNTNNQLKPDPTNKDWWFQTPADVLAQRFGYKEREEEFRQALEEFLSKIVEPAGVTSFLGPIGEKYFTEHLGPPSR